MIRNQWYAILPSRELKKGRARGLVRLGEKLVVWRDSEDNVACISDRCCHRGASLGQGKVIQNHIQCPFHGLEFNARGRCVLIPANGKTARVPESFVVNHYPARDVHGFVWIFWGQHHDELPEIPFFENISYTMHYVEMSSYWPVHYTRCIENQLDVLHLPFVHRNTIGKGQKTIVNGPRVDENSHGFDVFLKNEPDKGQKPLKPAGMPEPDVLRQHLGFLFPNLWQNFLTPELRIFISFTPVDESGTILYLRMYQNIVRIPLIRQLVDFIMMKYNMVILNQDKRVVIRQLPPRTSLRMDERLVMGDLPIVKYRQGRQRMLEDNNSQSPVG